ncbi:MAG: hypothetical protein KatS3mg010_0844 [Acidimicrobiia bacterium]|nr:MAG: hypothetical protein KatS3mg010_0844 [Acidimicrobiia bacterium]
MTVPDDAARDAAAGSTDAVEHFWRAAHELLAAARALIDAADGVVAAQLERTASPREGGGRAPRVRRIDVG